MTVAVVTAAAGRHDHLRRQREGLARGSVVPDRHVVVSMGDARIAADLHGADRTDVVLLPARDRLPLAAARNAGAARAVADGADVLVFLDVDVVPDRCLVQRYRDTADPGRILCGPVAYLPAGVTDPARFADHPFHPARPVPPDGVVAPMTDIALFWSLSFALRAATWETVGGFWEGYRGYGAEDTDFARQAVAAGVSMGWLGGAAGYHQHHPVSSPPVEHVDDILRNGALFRDRWGSWPMTGWLEAFAGLGLVRRVGDDWERTAVPVQS